MTSRSRETGRRWIMRRRPVVVRTAGTAVSVLALTAGLITFAAPGASAEPALTIAEAKQQVAQLESDSEALDQQWLAVEQKIKTTKTDLGQRQSDLKTQTAKVAALKTQFSQIALAEFQNRNLDTRAQLFMTRDTQGFLSQISTVEKVSDNQNAALQNLQAQQANLTSLQRAEAADLSGLQSDEKTLTTLRTDSDAKIKDAKAVLARLTEEQRQKIEAERKKQEAKSKAEAEAAAKGTSGGTPNAKAATQSTSDTSTSDSPSSDTGSGKGAVALAFAKRQLGKPYRFGATGPGAYDCSGLTLASWRSAGVSLSRTSQSQFSDGRAVSKSELKPGDLVFFYSGISHVGLYAGNGQIIHAPNSRSVVKYAPLDSMPFAGARRPG